MKIKNLFYTLFASVLLLAGATSCNDSTKELTLNANTVYIKLGEDASLIIYGNGGYQLKVSDESKLTATESNSVVTLHPLSKGTATLTVTDSDNQVATVTIHVRDPYMSFGVANVSVELSVTDASTKTAILKELTDNYIVKKDYLYDLTKNTSLSFVEYKGYWGTSERSGTYSFSEEAMELTLTAGTQESTFTIENNTYGKMFYDYFVSDKVPGSISEYPLFELTEDLTDIYKAQYPDKGVSKVEVTTNVQAFLYRAE